MKQFDTINFLLTGSHEEKGIKSRVAKVKFELLKDKEKGDWTYVRPDGIKCGKEWSGILDEIKNFMNEHF